METCRNEIRREFYQRNTSLPSPELLINLAKILAPEQGGSTEPALTDERYNIPIENLFPEDRHDPLDNRVYRALKRSGIIVIGQILEKQMDELLALSNFGPRSHEHLVERLEEFGFLPKPEEEQEGKGPSATEEAPTGRRRLFEEL